jgi:hypothetical protein
MPRMKTVILEAFRDENTGELGLGVVGMPRDQNTNAANDGLLIAHDLIEHVNGPEQIGSIDDELEALGAVWYVRGQHGELRRDGIGSCCSVEENLASDVVRMFRDHISGNQHVSYAPLRTRPVTHDYDLRCVLDYADASYLSDFNDWEYEEARRRWGPYRAVALHRMRMGYRKARRKWERKGHFAANAQFWAIAEATDRAAKHPEFEGMRYKLSFGNGEAYCEEDYEEDY